MSADNCYLFKCLISSLTMDHIFIDFRETFSKLIISCLLTFEVYFLEIITVT